MSKPTDYHALAGVTHRVYVVDSFACQDSFACKDESLPRFCHYEIQVAPEPDPEAPRIALVTTDRKLFDRAAAALGSGRRFDVAWHRNMTLFGLKYTIDRFDER